MSNYPEWLVEKVAEALVAGYAPGLEGQKPIWDVNSHDRIAAVAVLNELGFHESDHRLSAWGEYISKIQTEGSE